MSEKIIIIDDDANLLAGIKRQLRRRYDIATATSGPDGLRMLRDDGPFAVLLTDMRMPGLTGVDVLAQAREIAPETVRVMLTGNADQKTAVDAVNAGEVFRFLNKPCDVETLTGAIDAGLRQYRLLVAERELLERTLGGTVKVLVDILSVVNPVAFGLTRQSQALAGAIAGELHLADQWQVAIASMLSGIGWVTVPPEIIAKVNSGASLDAVEQALVDGIPRLSHDLVANIPRLEPVARIILGLGSAGGGDVPIESQILKIALDLVRASGDPAGAAPELSGGYDPEVVQALKDCLDKRSASEAATARQVEVTVAELLAGDVLIEDLRTIDGQLVLAEGFEVSTPLLAKIHNIHRLRQVGEPITVARSVPLAHRGETKSVA